MLTQALDVDGEDILDLERSWKDLQPPSTSMKGTSRYELSCTEFQFQDQQKRMVGLGSTKIGNTRVCKSAVPDIVKGLRTKSGNGELPEMGLTDRLLLFV